MALHPATGFQVASVHSIVEFPIFTLLVELFGLATSVLEKFSFYFTFIAFASLEFSNGGVHLCVDPEQVHSRSVVGTTSNCTDVNLSYQAMT